MVAGVDVDAEIELLDRVGLDVAASTENLRLVRLLVAAFGTSHGADVDDLEDLRIATDDLCAHLMTQAAAGSRLAVEAVTMRRDADPAVRIGVRAEIERTGSVAELDQIAALIIGAAADTFGLIHRPANARATWCVRPDGDGDGIELDAAPAEAEAPPALLTAWFCRRLGGQSGSDDHG